MKMMGAALILGAALWGWYVQSRERRERRRTRLDILSALRRMSEEIRLARTPMPELLEAVASDCSGAGENFFRAISSAICGGEDVEQAWIRAADRLALEEDERRALRELGQALGGDEEQLCRAAALTMAVLQRRAEEAEAQRKEEEKRCAAIWGCGGIMLVILLM